MISGRGVPELWCRVGRLSLGDRRLRNVTEVVAEKSGWGKRKHGKGTGVGIAAHRSFLTYVATVVEVEVNDQGEVRIPRVDVALDAGLVVNPKRLGPSSKAQQCLTAVAVIGDLRQHWCQTLLRLRTGPESLPDLRPSPRPEPHPLAEFAPHPDH